MENEINLQHASTVQADRYAKIVRVIAIILLGLVSLLTVIFFVLKINAPLSRLSQTETDLLASINQQNVKIARLAFIQERLGVASTYFRKRSDIKGVISILREDIPIGVSPLSLSVTSNEFSMILSSSSGELIHQYVINFQTKTSKNPMFRSVSIDTVSYDKKSNTYAVSVKGVLSDHK